MRPLAAERRPAAGRVAAALALVLLVCLPAAAEDVREATAPEHPERAGLLPTWPEDVLDTLASVPVQDGGRVKPLSTWARFFLRFLSGRTSYVPQAGDAVSDEARGPVAWVLDVLLYPEVAGRQRFFLVPDSVVLDQIGVSHEGRKKRDRYAWEELRPGWTKLERDARTYDAIQPEGRTRFQKQLLDLYGKVRQYHRIQALRQAMVVRLPDDEIPPLEGVAVRAGGIALATLPDVWARLERFTPAQRQAALDAFGTGREPEDEAALFLAQLVAWTYDARTPALFPPAEREREAWHSLDEIVAGAAFQGRADPRHGEILRSLFEVIRAGDDMPALRDAVGALHRQTVELSAERGEYDGIGLEIVFYRSAPFFWAAVVFLLAFVLLAFSWIGRSWRWAYFAAAGALGVGFALVTWGIVMRSVIRERPPMTGLYDTVPFITGVMVLSCFVIEALTRRRIALPVAALLGAGGMLLTQSYETTRVSDTMAPIPAVLDTNFWLWTHVTCVTIGYGAALLAGAFGHVYLLARVFGPRTEAIRAFLRPFSPMIYGTVCFALFFSLVGTILGGIWANESWGRFWGWDPKENGALMIVLWNLVILHARMGGWIRSFGLAVMSVAGGMVVAFSWWHVNQLGVGLHSYGHTEGVMTALWAFYAFELAVIATGLAWWLWTRASPGAR